MIFNTLLRVENNKSATNPIITENFWIRKEKVADTDTCNLYYHSVLYPYLFYEGLNGVNRQPSNGRKINRQPSKTGYFYRQPSNERAKISRQISLNDRDRLTKCGHQLVEQAINKSSGNGGDVITLIIHIVVILEDQ